MQLCYIYVLYRCPVPCADHLIRGTCICGHIIQQSLHFTVSWVGGSLRIEDALSTTFMETMIRFSSISPEAGGLDLEVMAGGAEQLLRHKTWV